MRSLCSHCVPPGYWETLEPTHAGDGRGRGEEVGPGGLGSRTCGHCRPTPWQPFTATLLPPWKESGRRAAVLRRDRQTAVEKSLWTPRASGTCAVSRSNPSEDSECGPFPSSSQVDDVVSMPKHHPCSFVCWFVCVPLMQSNLLKPTKPILGLSKDFVPQWRRGLCLSVCVCWAIKLLWVLSYRQRSPGSSLQVHCVFDTEATSLGQDLLHKAILLDPKRVKCSKGPICTTDVG